VKSTVAYIQFAMRARLTSFHRVTSLFTEGIRKRRRGGGGGQKVRRRHPVPVVTVNSKLIVILMT